MEDAKTIDGNLSASIDKDIGPVPNSDVTLGLLEVAHFSPAIGSEILREDLMPKEDTSKEVCSKELAPEQSDSISGNSSKIGVLETLLKEPLDPPNISLVKQAIKSSNERKLTTMEICKYIQSNVSKDDPYWGTNCDIWKNIISTLNENATIFESETKKWKAGGGERVCVWWKIVNNDGETIENQRTKKPEGKQDNKIAKSSTKTAEPVGMKELAQEMVNEGTGGQSTDKDNQTKCKICDKTFTRPYTLKMHILTTHLNKKPFHCQVCSAVFTRRESLKRHQVWHLNHFIIFSLLLVENY